MSSIQIENRIPVRRPHPKKGTSKYPLSSMMVGDAFVVHLDKRKNWGFIWVAIFNEQRRSNRKFATRATEDGGRRVWRIA